MEAAVPHTPRTTGAFARNNPRSAFKELGYNERERDGDDVR
jgi:hypothetical protein